MGKKNGKYSKELAQIKMLKSINSMLKTSDMENALLSNSASSTTSETVSDGMVDEMLGRINTERERNKDIFDVEKMTSAAVYTPAAKRRSAPKRNASKRSAPKRRHAVKRKGTPKRRKPQKKKRRR
jgi:hypothetical protein